MNLPPDFFRSVKSYPTEIATTITFLLALDMPVMPKAAHVHR